MADFDRLRSHYYRRFAFETMNPVTDAELIMMTLHDAKNDQTWSDEFNAQIELAIEAVRKLERENAELWERLRSYVVLTPGAPATAGYPDTRILTVTQGRCDTTLTERFHNPECQCVTYFGNLGPCMTWNEGSEENHCVYCDHTLRCHEQLLTLRALPGKPRPEATDK